MHLNLETDDVQAEVRRLEALGATRYDHQRERGYDFWVLRDPDTTSSASSRSTSLTCSPNARPGQTSALPKLALLDHQGASLRSAGGACPRCDAGRAASCPEPR